MEHKVTLVFPDDPLPEVDRDLTVGEVLVVSAHAGEFNFTTTTLATPYTKVYPSIGRPISATEPARFVARLGDRIAGAMQLSAHWTGFAQVDDIAVNRSARRKGVAANLLSVAKAWAIAQRLVGVRVETQNTNVPACKLYHASGFSLAGADAMLYRGTAAIADEIALFWYWLPHPGT
ncbi:MAG: GNAT family N-acetyltransferase [Burkholderiales bacterium]